MSKRSGGEVTTGTSQRVNPLEPVEAKSPGRILLILRVRYLYTFQKQWAGGFYQIQVVTREIKLQWLHFYPWAGMSWRMCVTFNESQ